MPNSVGSSSQSGGGTPSLQVQPITPQLLTNAQGQIIATVIGNQILPVINTQGITLSPIKPGQQVRKDYLKQWVLMWNYVKHNVQYENKMQIPENMQYEICVYISIITTTYNIQHNIAKNLRKTKTEILYANRTQFNSPTAQ